MPMDNRIMFYESDYNVRIKSWVWNLTIFAGTWNNTALGKTIYVQKNFYDLTKWEQERIIEHERVHIRQQREAGVLLFIFLYLFCFPILYNPFRRKWETEAMKEIGWMDEVIRKELSSWRYGWLLF